MLDVVRTVEIDAVLLYRVLPNGILGNCLVVTPYMQEEITKQCSGLRGIKQPRIHDDDPIDTASPKWS